MEWRVGRLVGYDDETATARTLLLEVPDWPGHIPGQHIDIRLTSPDGYSTQRSYSLAAPADGDRIEVTVQSVADGEVSSYLDEVFMVGDEVELRGPVGGWFVWRPDGGPATAPVLLVAGGSGIVPLMAMVRARFEAGKGPPFRLIYSIRSPAERYYVDDLHRIGGNGEGSGAGDFGITYLYTRSAPDGSVRPPGRITADDIESGGWSPERKPVCYVCGPTGFVEVAADLLVSAGHDPARIRTERFGPTGVPTGG